MNKSRTKNSIKNFNYGAITQVVNTIFSFIARTVFIKVLGEQYLGINGLFTNILTVLSFAELGIGNAIIFSMYKPVANQDQEKISALIKLYKKCYFTIGVVVLLIGICIIPFLNFIIKDPPNILENLNIIYLLYLLNTVFSYFFTYKKSILSAHQEEYIINKYKMFFIILKNILQICYLILTKHFIGYLIIQVICTFLENLVVSIKASKKYEYINRETKDLTKNEKSDIFNNVKSLVVYKFGSVILNGTDSIVISKLIGVTTVGIYSNYTLIVQAISSVIGTAMQGITASIGNLNATASREKKEKVFYDLLFISTWIFGFCSIALLILIDPFINLWIGNNYVLEYTAVLAIVLHFYINGVQFAGYTYRTTMGLFRQGKKAPIVAAILNIVLSILLGKAWGITGILLATSISRLCTTTWYDAYLVHKYEFKSSWTKFVKKYLFYMLVVIVNYIIVFIITNFIISGLIGFLFKSLIVLIIPNLIFLLVYYRKAEFKEIIETMKALRNGRNKKRLNSIV